MSILLILAVLSVAAALLLPIVVKAMGWGRS
jgi:hypothetical protein